MRILLHDKLKAWHEVLKLGEKPIELLNSRASRRDLPFPSAPQPKLVKTCRKERQAPIHSLVRAEPTIDTDWYLLGIEAIGILDRVIEEVLEKGYPLAIDILRVRCPDPCPIVSSHATSGTVNGLREYAQTAPPNR
jgi:hypothetical protein